MHYSPTKSEWVEDHADELRRNGMAYINIGSAVAGDTFHASGSPPLYDILMKVLTRVGHPKNQIPLRELWGDQNLQGLGAGGDYGAFQHFAGVSSIDIGFSRLSETEKWVPQSCHDSFFQISKTDPNFDYPLAMAQILALLILELADASNMPFNMTTYAEYTTSRFADLRKFATDKATATKQKSLDFKPLEEAVELMQKNMPIFDDKINEWTHPKDEPLIEFDGTVAAVHRISHNARMANFEHHLLEEEGVWGRTWYKHVLVAPSVSTPALSQFPKHISVFFIISNLEDPLWE